jgi:hypothetical protein
MVAYDHAVYAARIVATAGLAGDTAYHVRQGFTPNPEAVDFA